MRTLSACPSRVLTTITLALLLVPAQQAKAETGEELFKTRCAVCHTIGKGKGPGGGPDLAGVTEKRSEAWLLAYIESPQDMVDSGDAAAIAVFEEFKPIVMPDQFLDEDQIRSILAYIAAGETGAESSAPIESAPVVPATEQEISDGQDYFQGLKRFEKGGPACTSCHQVQDDAIIVAGGNLAMELTGAFTRAGGAEGLGMIIKSRPFPVMSAAYKDAPLSEDEIKALVGFLQKASAEGDVRALPLDMGVKLFGSGIVGVALLFGLYALLWGGRKRESVNQAIFDRQVKSS